MFLHDRKNCKNNPFITTSLSDNFAIMGIIIFWLRNIESDWQYDSDSKVDDSCSFLFWEHYVAIPNLLGKADLWSNFFNILTQKEVYWEDFIEKMYQ